jgi:hypothetical protein
MAESDEAKDNVTVLDRATALLPIHRHRPVGSTPEAQGTRRPPRRAPSGIAAHQGKKLVGLYRPHQHKRLWIRADP